MMRQWPARIGTMLAVIYPVGIITILYFAFRDVNEQDRQLNNQARPASAIGGKSTPMLRPDDLSRLVGNWSGTLEYLDYTDDKSRSRLNTTLTCKLLGTELQTAFSYVEPSGKVVGGTPTTWALTAEGTRIRIGTEEWTVQSRTDSDWELTRDGTDNNKPAVIRRIVNVEGNSLRIRTDIHYSGSKGSLTRNEYILTRN
ncbi:MAG: hypothetical protein K1X57_01265 [Gemmataceae bacterium]|nr:hypothetical protein [Gemmataceae bacterium]